MSEENRIYLPPKQQLFIAAKVNRLCETQPGKFNEAKQVDDAVDIVNALHSRIKPMGMFSIGINIPHLGRSGSGVANTGIGNIPVPIEHQTTFSRKYGIDSYRIGSYLGRKRVEGGSTFLSFQHFRKSGDVMAEVAFETLAPLTVIKYRPESPTKILEIYRDEYVMVNKTFLYIISYLSAEVAQHDVLWQDPS